MTFIFPLPMMILMVLREKYLEICRRECASVNKINGKFGETQAFSSNFGKIAFSVIHWIFTWTFFFRHFGPNAWIPPRTHEFNRERTNLAKNAWILGWVLLPWEIPPNFCVLPKNTAAKSAKWVLQDTKKLELLPCRTIFYCLIQAVHYPKPFSLSLPNGTSGTCGSTSDGFNDVANGVCGPLTRT